MGIPTITSGSIATSVGAIWNNAHTSIAVDSNDKLHLIYGNPTTAKIVYANNTGSKWSFWNVGNRNGDSFTSIAVDKLDSNKVHARWYYVTNLCYGNTTTGPTWTIKNMGALPMYSSESYDRTIVTDKNSKIVMSAYDYTNTNLVVLSSSDGGSNFKAVTIDNSGVVGMRHAIALDTNNRVHIIYADETNDSFCYINNTGSELVWDKYILLDEGTPGGSAAGWIYYQWCGIAVDSNNKIHCTVTSASIDGVATIVHINNTGSTNGLKFDIIPVAAAPGGASYQTIAVDKLNKAHIAFWEYNGTVGVGGIKYANNTSSELNKWTLYNIDDRARAQGRHPSIALDSNNKVYISYHTENCEIYTASITPNYDNSIKANSISLSVNPVAPNNATIATVVGGYLGEGANWYWYSTECAGSYEGCGNPITFYPSSSTTLYVRASGAANTTDCVSTPLDVGYVTIGFINGHAVARAHDTI